MAVSLSFGEVKKTPPPLILKHAERLINRERGGEIVKELIDNVWITRGDMSIKCEHAFHYEKAERIEFEREVYYADSLRELWADKLIYYIASDRLTAMGSVKIVQDTYETQCVRAEYSDQREDVHLYYDVHIYETAENMELTGDQGYGDKTMEYARVTGNCQLLQYDSTGAELMRIDAKMMEYYHSESRAQATDSVKIYKDDVTGSCRILKFFREEDKAVMFINPVVMRGLEEMRGDTIHIFFREEKISMIELFGSASALTPAEYVEGEYNQLYGGYIMVQLEEQKVKFIDAVDNAKSVYFLAEDEKPKGANSVSGDRLMLNFTGGELETINVITGVEGTYYPEGYRGVIK
ncbi:MAG: hypothetical protein H8E87_07550 [FCB group bacterium]|nr:hypothetical protein [FCB group bacterium]